MIILVVHALWYLVPLSEAAKSQLLSKAEYSWSESRVRIQIQAILMLSTKCPNQIAHA